MSLLLRLLTTGRTLVGLKDNVHRYRFTSQGLLPRFGPARNPFQNPAESRGETGLSATNVRATDSSGIPPVKTPAGASGVALTTPGKSGPNKPVLGQPPATRAPLGTKPEALDGWRRVGKWFSRASQAMPEIEAPAKRAVQYELSLERVQVVRNDLSDADLEIVAVKPAGPKNLAAVERPKVLATVPTRVARATTRLFGALRT